MHLECNSRLRPTFFFWLVLVVSTLAFPAGLFAAGSGSSAGGTSTGGGGGGSEAPKPAPQRPTGQAWWKSLHNKDYPLNDGSVLEFTKKGNDLICEWGRLEYGKSGVPGFGRLRMECMNCRHPYGVDLLFSRDLKTLRAHMGHMGTYSGKLGKATSGMRLAGPSGE